MIESYNIIKQCLNSKLLNPLLSLFLPQSTKSLLRSICIVKKNQNLTFINHRQLSAAITLNMGFY